MSDLLTRTLLVQWPLKDEIYPGIMFNLTSDMKQSILFR